MDSETKTIIISLISIGISLIAIYFKDQRIIIITIYSITLVSYILFTYLTKIEEHEKQINNIKKALKRTDDLIDLKADIKFIKKELR